MNLFPNILRSALILLTLTLTAQGISAQSTDDRLLREGPVNVQGADENSQEDIQYPFLRYSANVINLNEADWTELRKLYKESKDNAFSIVNIGDSHLQADIGTGELRRLIQKRRGNAGRGLIAPLKLAGTNEPADYRLTLSSPVDKKSILVRRPWQTPMTFTGVGVKPVDNAFDLTLEMLGDFPENFRFMRVYTTGDINVTQAKSTFGTPITYAQDKNLEDGYVDLFFDAPVSSVVLSIFAPAAPTIHGLMLSKETPGIFYHVIGNNGASYKTYGWVDNFGKGVSTLYPDLIIVSMGTNDAYNSTAPEEFRRQLDDLVKELARENPDAKIMLTTPKEAQRKTGSGRASRYEVVDKIKTFRDIILEYGRQNKIPVYDFYTIAGGDGASFHWVEEGLLGGDRVHNTKTGYRLFGNLFYEALDRALSE